MKKELLIKELCARLPYRLKCSFGVDDAIYEITGINPGACGASEIQATHIKSSINGDFKLNSCKPYLFPLSSMTEEQREKLHELWDFNMSAALDCAIYGDELKSSLHQLTAAKKVNEWCYENHFDINGLISMELANDATGLNIYTNYDNN